MTPGNPESLAKAVLKPCADATETARIAAATRRWLERAVIGLNLCPFAKAAPIDFVEYNAFLRQADAVLRHLGHEGVVQIASFHPHYEFAGSASDDIENYTNRSPYPLLHLLREASVDRAVAAFPDAADIYEKNIETMRRLGHEGWRRLWVTGDPDV